MGKLVSTECSGCRRLEVMPQETYDAIDQSADEGAAHHVIPDDQNRDWICYGKQVAIEDQSKHDQVLTAFAERSIFGLVDLAPSKEERVSIGSSVESVRLKKTYDIESVALVNEEHAVTEKRLAARSEKEVLEARLAEIAAVAAEVVEVKP